MNHIQKDPRQNRSARTSEPKHSYRAQIQMGPRKAHQICNLKRKKSDETFK